MRLPRILNQCHPVTDLSTDKPVSPKTSNPSSFPSRRGNDPLPSALAAINPRQAKTSLPRRGRFEFIGFWGYLVFPIDYRRRVDCLAMRSRGRRSAMGHGKHSSTKVHMHFLGHWARKLSREGNRRRIPHLLGQKYTTRWPIWSTGR
jgi:hypothetical protein